MRAFCLRKKAKRILIERDVVRVMRVVGSFLLDALNQLVEFIERLEIDGECLDESAALEIRFVYLTVKRQVFRCEYLADNPEMERIGVYDHSVKIKNDM